MKANNNIALKFNELKIGKIYYFCYKYADLIGGDCDYRIILITKLFNLPEEIVGLSNNKMVDFHACNYDFYEIS